MCALNHVSPFVTPWTVALQVPLSMGFSRQEYWSGLPCLPPGDLPNPGVVPMSPALQADCLPSEPPGKPSSSSRCLATKLCPTLYDPVDCRQRSQASLSFTISQSLLKLMSIESVMPSNHLILCCPLLLPSIFRSIRVFSNELTLRIRWPKYWRFIFSISPSSESETVGCSAMSDSS